jgi:hypothetical protein
MRLAHRGWRFITNRRSSRMNNMSPIKTISGFAGILALPYGADISIEAAKKVAAGTVTECAKAGFGGSVFA